MKILHIAVHLGGGAGKAIAGIIPEGKRDNHTVILLEYPKDSKYKEILDKKNIRILIAPFKKEIYAEIEKADVVIMNWWGHPLMVRFLAEFDDSVKCRLVIWNHINGCTYPYLPFSFLNLFSYVLFTSPHSYENTLWSEEEKRKIQSKSTLVYGMGDFRPETVSAKNNYDNKKIFTVGYIGTLNYGKLSEDFIEWYERAAERVSDIRFVVAGSMSEEVKWDIQRSKIEDKIESVGYVNNTERYYKKFDVFAYLLNRENYGTTENVLLEAMSYGLPIIIVENEAQKHIVENGKNGYVVKNAREFAEKIGELREDAVLREKIGKKARQCVIKQYNKEKNDNEFYRVCRAMMQNSKKNYRFTDVLSGGPIDFFMYFSQEDGHKVKQYLIGEMENLELDIRIFKERSKGSIYQYAEYFPDDRDFLNLKRGIAKGDNL